MFRRVLLASAGAMALARTAVAADLAPPPVCLPPPPVFTWTGFYAGLNAGYTFGGSNSVDVETASGVAASEQTIADAVAASATGVLSLHNSGFIGGGQVGYNLQFADVWLVGIEADLQGTGARSSGSAIGIAPIAGIPPSIVQAQSNIAVNAAVDYLGTVRGRLGFLATPTLLIYGDGGFAYGGVHMGVDNVATEPPTGEGTSPAFGSFTNTRPGWTAGGGLEWMFSPNWSLKAEYLHYDLGRAAFAVGGLTHFSLGVALFTDLSAASTRFDGHIVRVGLNYHFDWWNPGPAGGMALACAGDASDLPGRAPPPVFLPLLPVMTWTGFYAGLNAGYSFGGSNSVDVDTAPGVAIGSLQPFANFAAASATDVLSLNNSGFIGGGQVGYNLQFANAWLVGIEADIQGTGARSSASDVVIAPVAGVPLSILQPQSNISVNNAVDYLGTVRGRLGFLATPALLIYGDGGFAYGGVHEGVDIVATFPPTGVGLSPAFGSFSNTRPGWTAGGGLEWMFSPNWSLKAEYLYYDLGRVAFGVGGLTLAAGTTTFFTDPATASTRFNGHIVRVGLNYHFNWGPAPVIAKY